jgi:O-methyltransferase
VREEDRPYRYHLSLVKRVLGETPVAGRKVLEVGCGRGGNCDFLSRYAMARSIVGIDSSPANVRFCRRRHPLDTMAFLVGDAEKLPARDASFDVVLNLESAHCYDDFAAFVSEVHRVLRPGGYFCFGDTWGWQMLPVDWGSRESILHSSPLAVRSEEDITQDVIAALEEPDGMAATLPLLRGESNETVRALIEGARGVRSLLASGRCSYRIVRLFKG